jgi:hypothetical protein
MPIADQDIKKLWGLAAGRCSQPSCGIDCVKFFGADATVLGEMAHVIARQPKGRRGVPGGGSNAYENLILLCPNHHTEIDKAPEGTFSIEILHQWKSAHERRVTASLEVKPYTSRADMFRDIELLLTDNYQLWKTFGPESEEAQRNPMSNAAQFWQLRKVSQIIPNNTKICAMLDGGRSLITIQEYKIASEFKLHAEGFAANAIERLEGYPRFPEAFRKMVESNG